ncbi:hypothetical protein O181_040554 [Austropuccinia psidii MF-1]|uniref:Integrase catalytic domain-containing protein n=1 Tax=Austropuccinia psidii MF-1 TaxID=1389203 RepID=A0A9Q3DCH3_9BASI|nr:hypothetical protein [Austropuccinia psidii MF-1]
MDWVTGLPPGGDRSYNACLVIVDRFSKNLIFLPFHKDDKAMVTALPIWNIIVSWTGIFTNIISDRDLKLTSELWTNLHQFFGTKLSFSTAYHPQTDGLSERMIQTSKDMVGGFSLELAYKTSIHTSTNKTPAILEKGWNPKLPHDSLRNYFLGIHPTASSFKGILDKPRKHKIRCIEDSFSYSKDKWDKYHTPPDFKVGYLVFVSTNNFHNIKGLKRLKDTFVGPFFINALHGENAIEVELSEELSNKHPKFSVSLVKPYKSSDAENFSWRNKLSQHIPPIE